jgi:hypothetical protein
MSQLTLSFFGAFEALLDEQPLGNFRSAKVSKARRRLLHRRAFETLQRSAPAAADLAHHALNAGLLVETIHHSLIAGNEAMAIFAVRVAIPHYETAWQLAEQKGWPASNEGLRIFRF